MSSTQAGSPLRHWFDVWNTGDSQIVRGLFSRALGIVYLVAFISFATQVLGLIGSRGLLPINDYLSAVSGALGITGYYFAPTVFWVNSSDLALQILPWVGAVLAVLLILGVSHPLLYLALYILYLSLVTAGQDFMSFQWDNLLLEAGFLAIFLRMPGSLIVWLYRLLLFKLMFMSGAVKLVSGDPNWRNLTALDYHYWTQPIPNVIAWYAAQLPEWIQRVSVAATLFIEFVVPFFIFTTRRLRAIAGILLIGLQLLIQLTGNFTFFNWLALALCLYCFDDAMLRRILPASLTNFLCKPFASLHTARGWTYVFRAVAIVLIVLSVADILPLVAPVPAVISDVDQWLQPLRMVSSYGLFAVMTTDRPEIIIEGSNDGDTWQAYQFPYKAGDVKRMPPFVAPFQPRLDWQMWFEGLEAESGAGPDRWFTNLLVRLLQGSPDVLALVQTNPFPYTPPRYIRARVEQYRFADAATHAQTGAWWTHTPQSDFIPALSLGGTYIQPGPNLNQVFKR